ncbi:hypothetical protein JX265_009418 [Neoarthrinium moseri]|uniref:MARVEL domain-containing protein n=1 Tax=Neoarthrinium moseri TaxID=1658444 RepID=A0A9P9WGA4_9PEZI|nr:uncharacterized protein JN550_010234 [Neoarthrinium moseri]KAI1841809.1 hypothetical protein JX266_011986 [Neoarthrinium moseri]KAI1861915.1 hypothetical protein JX265_009418 [Neoarthrinium moseri]KAI1862372.1 hypothetical protein JN550_010234 [Neoarthrinium moseri]
MTGSRVGEPTPGTAGVVSPAGQQRPAPPATAPYPAHQYSQPGYAPRMRIVPFSKAWHWTKIAIRAFSLVSCVILIGLSGGLAAHRSYSGFSLSFLWIIPFAVFTAAWNIAEFITIGACGKRHGSDARRGIHPGAHVGVDLIIWLVGIFSVFVSAVSSVSAQRQLRTCQEYLAEKDSDSYRYYYQDYCEGSYEDLKTGITIPMLRAITAFLAFVTLIHFVLFVRACVETNQRNHTRANVMMVPPQAYYGAPVNTIPFGSAYPMAPPQAHSTVAQAGPLGEKSTVPHSQNDHSNLAGFYAPAGPVGSTQQHPQTETRNMQSGSNV